VPFCWVTMYHEWHMFHELSTGWFRKCYPRLCRYECGCLRYVHITSQCLNSTRLPAYLPAYLTNSTRYPLNRWLAVNSTGQGIPCIQTPCSLKSFISPIRYLTTSFHTSITCFSKTHRSTTVYPKVSGLNR